MQRTSLAPISRFGIESARAVPAQDQVAVLLVGVGLLRALVDLDQTGVDRAGAVLERALELQVAGRVRRLVQLPGVVVEELVAVGEEDAEHLGQRVLARAGATPIEFLVNFEPSVTCSELSVASLPRMARSVMKFQTWRPQSWTWT